MKKEKQQAEAPVAVAVVVDEKELKNFDVVESWIQEMKEVATGLTIANVDDKAGYEKVHETRMIVKNKRCAIENKRAELKEKYSLAPGRIIDGEAKRITALLLPIETELETKQRAIDAEKKRLAEEEAKAKAKKIQDRVITLLSFGMTLQGDAYILDEYHLPVLTLHTATDEEFVNYSVLIETRFHQNEEIKKQQAEQEKAAQEEKDRIMKEQEDQISAQAELIAKLQANQKPEAPAPVISAPVIPEISDKDRLDQLMADLDNIKIPGIHLPEMKRKENRAFIKQMTRELNAIKRDVLKQWNLQKKFLK